MGTCMKGAGRSAERKGGDEGEERGVGECESGKI